MGLSGISPIISPELLVALARMGHGDKICFADAHFPSESIGGGGSSNKNNSNSNLPLLVRADGHEITPLLKAVAKLIPLDTYTEFPVQMMAAVVGDELDPAIEVRFAEAVESAQPSMFRVERVERFEFYERARSAFVVVATGETAKYGNVILTKGVLGVGLDDAGDEVYRLPDSSSSRP